MSKNYEWCVLCAASDIVGRFLRGERNGDLGAVSANKRGNPPISNFVSNGIILQSGQ